MSEAVLKQLASKFKDEVIATHKEHGDETAILKRDKVREIALWLRDDPKNQFNMMRDVTAVDLLLISDGPRFEVVYHLYSLAKKHSIRLKVPLEEADPVMDSMAEVWAAANWGEREVWDMYGIKFADHPDLRRILLYEEFEGHPLRKDYDKRRSQPRIDMRIPERDAGAEYRNWASSQAEKD